MAKDRSYNRREFINKGARLTLGLSLAGVGTVAAVNSGSEKYVWQVDPLKCTQCGRCATDCVLSPSAVKCVHAYDLCGYCDLCGGYFKPGVTELETGAEKQLCPAAAIERKFIEEPYFEYIINEDLCIGCAKCVKGCSSFGNGSLHLQIRHNICVNCNECSIARVCPSDAIKRVPASEPYIIKGDFSQNGEETSQV
ncbi:MAG: ferredoxin [Bacteroidales bacterium]|nr:ferredoxin [Bacteroidales bacterium]